MYLLVKTSALDPRPLLRREAAYAGAKAAKVTKMLQGMGLEHEAPGITGALSRDVLARARGAVSPREARAISFRAFRNKMGI